jgi:cyanate lyase
MFASVYSHPTKMVRRCIGQRATGTSSVLTSSTGTGTAETGHFIVSSAGTAKGNGDGNTRRYSSALAARNTGAIQYSLSPLVCRSFSAASAGTTDPNVKAAATARLLLAKQQSGLTFQELADAVSVHEVFLASAIYGQNSLSVDTAQQLLHALHIFDNNENDNNNSNNNNQSTTEHAKLLQALTDYPLKTGLSEQVPTDPLIYRFHEITQMYGVTMKAIIQEKLGADGIMSAIDFKMDIQKQEHAKGDRVIVTLNGKFLPYNKW